MKLGNEQIQAVLTLPGQERYNHFVKQIVDQEEVWGLYKDGWALAGSEEGEQIFPLWPAEEYAALCAQNEWEGYEPSAISLEDLLGELLPQLEQDGICIGVFYTPNDKGVVPDFSILREDLERELEKYN